MSRHTLQFRNHKNLQHAVQLKQRPKSNQAFTRTVRKCRQEVQSSDTFSTLKPQWTLHALSIFKEESCQSGSGMQRDKWTTIFLVVTPQASPRNTFLRLVYTVPMPGRACLCWGNSCTFTLQRANEFCLAQLPDWDYQLASISHYKLMVIPDQVSLCIDETPVYFI